MCKQKGFTLIEPPVVISIIGLLTSLLMPLLAAAMARIRGSAKLVILPQKLRQNQLGPMPNESA